MAKAFSTATLALVREVVAPHLESIYPLDPFDRGLGGVSLGGMFACWSLLARPAGFRRVLAVSPSVYWDDHLLLDKQRLPAVSAGRRDVYLAVGERGTGPQRQWPATLPHMRDDVRHIDLVAGLRRLDEPSDRPSGPAADKDDAPHAAAGLSGYPVS